MSSTDDTEMHPFGVVDPGGALSANGDHSDTDEGDDCLAGPAPKASND